MTNSKVSILITLLPHLLCTMVYGMSPCTEYFTYMTNSGKTDMLGQIEIPSPSENNEFYLQVVLNTATKLPRQTARLELVQPIKESIRTIQQDRPLLYHVYFPLHEPIPTLSAIWLNDQQYCSGPEISGNTSTTIELKHTVYPLNKEPLSQNSRPWHRNSSNCRMDNPSRRCLNYMDHFKPTTVIPFDEMANNVLMKPIRGHRVQRRNSNNNNHNIECGITSYYTDNANRLISNSEEKSVWPGQWPWVVALYLLIPDELVNEFKCAGTILTTKHVITAAVCLMSDSSGINRHDTIDSDNLFVAFGLFNSRQWTERGTINREVASYKIHSDFAHTSTADSDLAVLTLRTSVEYNAFIKPICLWSGSANLQDVVSRMGYIVGWAREKSGKGYTDEPRMARVPIVSQENCHWSDPNFIRLTSNRTFCAGLRDGSEPCGPISGSGLMLFDALTGRYQLRGIVSRSLPHFQDNTCLSTKYTIYVDVAKYTSWIQQQISVL